MKKILTVLLLIVAIRMDAQITITSANMPSINDTIRYTTAPNGQHDFTLTGANYSWNYGTLGISSQTVEKFQALTSTPYSTLAFTGMPVGAIGVKIADSVGSGQAGLKNIYNFYEKKTAGWNAVGTGFTLSALALPAGGVYSDKDEIYTFPLNYNDQDSTTFAVKTLLGNVFISFGYYKQKGYRINKVEGWGTITTPYGNTISCLKVKSTIMEVDSFNIPTASLNVGFPNNRVEYKWLSTTEKIPVLEVSGTELAGVFTPTTIKYRDHYRVAPISPLLPKIKFTVDKNSGKILTDTFKLINSTTPAFGTTYAWAITPSVGVAFVKGTSSTSTNPSLVFGKAGTYTVKLTATNFSGAKDSTAVNMITISDNSGVKSIQNSSTFFYPNPVNSHITFNNPAFENSICRIFNLSGQLVSEQIVPANLTIDCKALAKGIYNVVVTGGELIFHSQLIKE